MRNTVLGKMPRLCDGVKRGGVWGTESTSSCTEPVVKTGAKEKSALRALVSEMGFA